MITYSAYVMAENGEGTEEVDIRTLSADRLSALRDEAGSAGDRDLVAAIDSLSGSEYEQCAECGDKHSLVTMLLVGTKDQSQDCGWIQTSEVRDNPAFICADCTTADNS